MVLAITFDMVVNHYQCAKEMNCELQKDVLVLQIK